jgi:hypothetical protein
MNALLADTRKTFLVFGLLSSVGLMLYQYFLFLMAYTSPQKAVALYINVFGEADIELVLMTICAIVGIGSTFTILVMIWKGKIRP